MESNSSSSLPYAEPVRRSSRRSSIRSSRGRISKSIPAWLVQLGVKSKSQQLGFGFSMKDLIDYSKKSNLVQRIQTATGVHRVTALFSLIGLAATLYLISLLWFPLNATSLLIVVLPTIVSRDVSKVEVYWALLVLSVFVDFSLFVMQMQFPQLYTTLKTAFFAWIASPQTQGALKLYKLAKQYDLFSVLLPDSTDRENIRKALKRYSRRIEVYSLRYRRWFRNLVDLSNEDTEGKVVDTNARTYRDQFEGETSISNTLRLKYLDLAVQEFIETERSFTTEMVQLSADLVVPMFEESAMTMKWSSKDAETHILGFFQALSELIPIHVRLNATLQSLCYDRRSRINSLKQYSRKSEAMTMDGMQKRPQSEMKSALDIPIFVLPDSLDIILEQLEIALEDFDKYDELAFTYDAAMAMYTREVSTNKQFANFINHHSRNLSRHVEQLESYLIKPIQRVCRYPLLLKSIMKSLPPRSIALIEKHEEVEDVLHRINERVQQVNRMAGVARKVLRMNQVHDHLRVPGYVDPTQVLNALADRERLLEMDFPAHIRRPRESLGRYHVHHLFLYNDILVIGHVKQESLLRQQPVYYFTSAVQLQGATVEATVHPSTESSALDAAYEIALTSRRDKVWVIGIYEQEVFEEFNNSVRNSIGYANKHFDSSSTVYQLLSSVRRPSVVTEMQTGVARVSKGFKGKFSSAFKSMRNQAATTVQRAYRGSLGRLESKKRKQKREARVLAALVIRKWILKLRRQRRLADSGKVIRLQNSYTGGDLVDNQRPSSVSSSRYSTRTSWRTSWNPSHRRSQRRKSSKRESLTSMGEI